MPFLFVLVMTIISINVFTFTTAAARPQVAQVAASILADSGLGEARHLAHIEYNNLTNGTDRHSEHRLSFKYRNRSYTCETFNLSSTPINDGDYFVDVVMSDCASASGQRLILDNDYTNQQGVTHFRRIFYDHNKKFRRLNSEEERYVARRNQKYFRSSSELESEGQIHILHTNSSDSDLMIIDSTGEVFPLN